MLKKLLPLAMAVIFSLAIVNAEVIDFESLGGLLGNNPSSTPGVYWDDDPTGFQVDGFQFDMGLMSQSYYQNSYANSSSFPSPQIAVYANDASDPGNPFSAVTISTIDGSLFNFLGAYFGGFTYADTVAWYAATQLLIEGYADGNLVNSISFDSLHIGFQYTPINMFGIDTLVFTATQGSYDYAAYNLTNSGVGSYWMMDNFEYSVPEPATLLLLSGGLLGLAVLRKKYV